MKNKTLKNFLEKYAPCEEGFNFAKDMTLEQFLGTCERGDWILWLFERTNYNDKRSAILAAAHCANTVRHLMKDERSIAAVDTAIRYGNNEASEEELQEAAARAARAAAFAADAAFAARAAAFADADAAFAARAAAFAAAFAARAAAFADADAARAARAARAAAFAAAFAAAKKQNQKITADICRKYLPLEIWN